MLIINVIVKVVLDCCTRASKAVVSFRNLYVESLCSPSEDAEKCCVKLLFLDIYLLADTKEDFNLVIKQVVYIACVLVAVILEL